MNNTSLYFFKTIKTDKYTYNSRLRAFHEPMLWQNTAGISVYRCSVILLPPLHYCRGARVSWIFAMRLLPPP